MTTISLYKVAKLHKPSFLQRLFKQAPEENVIIEINNLLASKPLLEIQQSDISRISSRYQVDAFHIYKKNFYEFYAVLLNFFLRDKKLNDEQHKNLSHLKGLLGLSNYDRDIIHTKLCSSIYYKRFQAVISDGRLSDDNKAMLDKFEKNLVLPSKIAVKISEELRGNFVRARLDEIVKQQRLSPEEEAEFTAIQKSLKVNVEVDKKTKQILKHYKELWRAENEALPVLDVALHLLKGEHCHFTSRAQWHEERINRGIPYWKYIDDGHFFLTNKRVIFVGHVKNTNIRLEKVLSFNAVENGVQLNKDTGKIPRVIFQEDADIFLILFPRVMRASDW